MDGDPEIQQYREWMSSVLRMYVEDGSSTRAAKPKQPKRVRLTTYWWMLMLNTFLLRMLGEGLESFSSDETAEAVRQMSDKSPLLYLASLAERCRSKRWPWRWLGVPLDQCAIGICGANYMRNKLRILMEPLFDPSHRVTRDLILAVNMCDLMPLLLLMKLIYTFSYGPWDGGKWWQSAFQFARANIRDLKADVAGLWNKLLPRIAVDVGRPGAQRDSAWCDSILDGLIDSAAVSSKGPRMAICQWMSWIHCTRYWDPMFHRRLFVLLLLCIHLGLVKGDCASVSLKAETLTAALDAHGNKSKKAQEKTAASLKSIGKNTVHSALICYMQGWRLQRRLRFMVAVAYESERWYHALRETTRSAAGTREFYMHMVGERALSPLCDTFVKIWSADTMQSLGLVTCEADFPIVMNEDSHRTILDDEEHFGTEIMDFTLALVACRLRSLLWHSEGLPGAPDDGGMGPAGWSAWVSDGLVLVWR